MGSGGPCQALATSLCMFSAFTLGAQLSSSSRLPQSEGLSVIISASSVSNAVSNAAGSVVSSALSIYSNVACKVVGFGQGLGIP